MEYKEFFSEIKSGGLRPAYLLHGEEEYSKERAVEALKALLAPDFFEFNFASLEDGSAGAIVNAAEQLPMLDERRLVLVTGSRYLSKSSGEEGPADLSQLLEYLERPNPTTVLAFVHRGRCDARLKLFKAVEKLGGAVAFDYLSEPELCGWLVKQAAQRGASLGRGEAMALVDMVGRGMHRLSGELSKLCDYSAGRPITREMLELCVTPDVEHNTFRMLDEFLSGRTANGLAMLDAIFASEGKDAGYAMVGAIASKLRGMSLARQALDMGKSPKQAAAFVGGSAFAAKRSVESAGRFTMEALDRAVTELCDLDLRMKTETLDARAQLERFMLAHFGPGGKNKNRAR